MGKVKLISAAPSFIAWNYLQNFRFTRIYLFSGVSLTPQTNTTETFTIFSKMYVCCIVSKKNKTKSLAIGFHKRAYKYHFMEQSH